MPRRVRKWMLLPQARRLLSFPVRAAPLIDKMVAVSEEWIAISILRLVEMEKAVVEGGGAVGVAALLAGLLPELKGKK